MGITPAYAGKTKVHYHMLRQAGDHPRVCGKDLLTRSMIPATKGSPPRMRERRNIIGVLVVSIGITPAYAGKTASGI